MKCDASTNYLSASSHDTTINLEASKEDRENLFQIHVRDVVLNPNGGKSVRGFSLATLAAALAACGGGGSGGPTPPPPAPPAPANSVPTLSDAEADATEDSDTPLAGTADGADADGDDLTYSVTANGTYGSLTIDDAGAWTYTVDDANDEVNALNVGSDPLTDTATIEVSDGQDSVTATVTFTIMGANDAPTLSDAAADIAEDSDMPLMGTADGADVDSETLTYSVAENGMYGSLVVDEMGAWTYTVDEANEMVNALNEGDTLTDTLTIEVSDGQTSTTAMATFTIMGANDAPTLSDAAADIAEDSDMPLMGTADGADVDSETLTYSVAENGMYGSLVVDEMGAWTYTVDEANEMVNALNEGDTLTDTLTIEVSDGQTSTTAMATFTIMGANDAPTLSDAAADIAEDSDMPLMGTADGADVDSETLTYSVAENGMYGSLVVDEMGAWTYTVDEANEMVNALNEGDTLTDTLTIEVSDGQTSTTAMATFTIMGANDAPTLSDAAADIAEDSDMPLMGTADGADVDSETLTYSVAENGMYGSLVVDEMGAWTYTVDEANEMVNALNEGDTLTDTLTIEVSDGQDSVTAMVTITIMGARCPHPE